MEDFVVDSILQDEQEQFIVAWLDLSKGTLNITEPPRTELETRERLRELELSPTDIELRIQKARAHREAKRADV